jgi:uncharacterized protein YhaN
VIFLRSQILGFGRLKDLVLNFQKGLNLVFAENEGGKSTLQRFLIGLLYGQLRSDIRAQRRLDPWVEMYKPWRSTEYGGILWCRLGDGRELEIHRSFGREETRVEIRTVAGEDITGQYEQRRNGDVLFASFHLGMPKELFESVSVIRENKVAEMHGYETIRDRIANLAHSGDEELSVRRSLSELQSKLDAVGSERAPTKPFKQAQERVQALKDEWRSLEERRSQFQNWMEERKKLASEIAKLEQELAKTRKTLLAARRRESAARVRSLEEMDRDLLALRNEIESLGARADFPSDGLEELNRLVGAHDNILKQLADVREEKDAALDRLAAAGSDRDALSAYASFSASAEAEKLTEWFVNYLGISLQKDGLQKAMSRLRGEAETLENRLSKLSPAFAEPNADWQRLALEAAEDEQVAGQNCTIIADSLAREKEAFSTASRSAWSRRILAILALLAGGASVAAPFVRPFPQFPPAAGIGGGLLLAAISVILIFASMKSAKTAHSAKTTMSALENELASVRKEGGKKRRQINEVMNDSGFHKLDDFLSAAKQAEQDRQKLADLHLRLTESDNQQRRLDDQSSELYHLLKEGLAKVGLVCSPGNLKFQIDVLRNNLRRFRELDAIYASCVQQADAMTLRDAEMTREFDSKRAGIQSLLDLAGVGSVEAFRLECLKRQKLLELIEKETSRTREFQRLAGEMTLPQWKEQFLELEKQQEAPHAEESTAQPPLDGATPFLPYQPTIAELEEQEKKIADWLSRAREDFARAVERITQAFQNFRSSSEIEEDLIQAEQDLKQLDTNRIALGIALDAIEKLSRQQQEVLAPQLNAAVEQRFLRLCGRRYEEVKIDPDFQIWVREPDSGELRASDGLSRGTQDQIYFSMRFGVLDLVSAEEEPCPSLLDEPFAAYDRVRLTEAFEILASEALRRQLILFTCREDLLDLARRHNAHVIRLAP